LSIIVGGEIYTIIAWLKTAPILCFVPEASTGHKIICARRPAIKTTMLLMIALCRLPQDLCIVKVEIILSCVYTIITPFSEK